MTQAVDESDFEEIAYMSPPLIDLTDHRQELAALRRRAVGDRALSVAERQRLRFLVGKVHFGNVEKIAQQIEGGR